MPYLKFMLDLDTTKEEAEDEAKRITAENPSLGLYSLEQSEGGNWHVIWHRSHLKTFHEGYLIALDSKCDKDWLDICKKYQIFALFTHNSLATTRKLHKRLDTERGTIAGTRLIIIPENDNELKRILSVSKTITDPTWTYRTEYPVGSKTRVIIGCLDAYQAERRVTFLREKCGLKFKEEIINA